MTVTPSLCRICPNGCAILVEHDDDGKVVRVDGDRDNPVYHGYSCTKGRAQPELLRHPERLLHSLKRQPDGSFAPIPVERAMDEIAVRLGRILDEHGPRAIAGYSGTYTITSPITGQLHTSLLRELGTPMSFNSSMIDKPGKPIAKAMHGSWMAPQMGYDDPDVGLLVGLNPFVAYQGFPLGHPGAWLREQQARGFKLIVIDPRRSDVARRAFLHLQVRPGQDAAVLASMARLILAEQLADAEFLDEHVAGVDALRAAVEPFTVELVAARADVDPDDLVLAARTFAASRRGYAQAGTGPNMHGRGTLCEYLVLVLDTLCGHWPRAGRRVRNPGTLMPRRPAKAQARSPWQAYGFGEQLRVRGLTDTVAGLPTTALPEEILQPGEGQVRALLSMNGNPAVAFPDQLLTHRALETLELLVQIDPWMSATARLADYVIAPLMPLEVAGTSYFTDAHLLIGNGYGPVDAYAQVTASVAAAPAGSDLIEEWELYYGLAQRLGLALDLAGHRLDMATKPMTDTLLAMLHSGGRVSLDEVRQHPHGALFPDENIVVEPADLGWAGRFDIGNIDMMRDIADVSAESLPPAFDNLGRPVFRLICRRMTHVMNSACNIGVTNRGRGHNPAFMHPDDRGALGLRRGDTVEIRSATAAIIAVVQDDPNLRRGTLSMAHGFGGAPDRDGDLRSIGSPTSRLVGVTDHWERYSGQPRMSDIPVVVSPHKPA